MVPEQDTVILDQEILCRYPTGKQEVGTMQRTWLFTSLCDIGRGGVYAGFQLGKQLKLFTKPAPHAGPRPD